MDTRRLSAGDVWGGLAASAVVLPQAIAFGVTLLAPGGFTASQGAIAGLLGAAIVCIISGVSGGTRGLISSPTGPTLVLLAGAMASFMANGITGGELLLNLMAVIIITGLMQILIGLSGGGHLIKYIPYPVVSGFLTGSAILMVISQVKPLSGNGYDESWSTWWWLPLLAALVTLLATELIPRFNKQIPGTIAGLFTGTILFHLLALVHGAALPDTWLIGQLPAIDSAKLDLSIALLQVLDWHIILPAAITLSILASVDTLLTSVIADVNTGARHSANRELVGQGLGQISSGFSGGMAVAGTTGATVVAIKSGGRRWAAVIAGVTLFAMILFARDIGRILPISVLAGIILSVSLHMLDLDIVGWLKRKKTRQDAGIALLVTGVTVGYDLMAAVAVGVVIAIIQFIRTQIRMHVVHRRSTRKQVRSVLARSVEERNLLEENGDRIILYELRGNLFFATADSLLEKLANDLDRPNYIILHLRRVLQIDLTAIKFFHQIAARLKRSGGQLIFCNVHKEIGIGKKMNKALRRVSPSAIDYVVKTFNGRDEALEYAENALLRELGLEPAEFVSYHALAENELCIDLADEERAELQTVLQPRFLETGEKLFSVGETGEQLYLVLSGEIEIRLPTTKHHYKRLATNQPGTYFGELSLLNPGPRAADAVAVYKTEVLILSRDGLNDLANRFPTTAIKLLMSLARTQGDHLRWTTMELRHLSEW